MNDPGTIYGFLRQTGAEALVLDVGRRVVEVPRRRFEAFEHTRQPYPLPFQQHAWFGVLFWRPTTREEPLIWFLKLPLDERGLLVPAARDAFLYQILDLAQTPTTLGRDTAALADALAASPCTFRPREERLGVFHAKAARALHRPASRYYEPARS